MSINNRWFQLCASLVCMIMIANLQYSWTLFVQPLGKATGWKLSDIQGAFTLFILCQTWVQPLDGWLIDRLGPRGFITAAVVLCGQGWAGIASEWWLYGPSGLVIGLLALIVAGSGGAWPHFHWPHRTLLSH